MKQKFPLVYFNITIGSKPAGRVIFELFTDLTPKTAENFRGLCTGEYGDTSTASKTARLHYLNTKFHRIINNFVIQGGDITNGDGTGGSSIYGKKFADENFTRRHACAGLLSMANSGRNSNSSQFFITLKAAPHLDGKHVVFGQVTQGIDVIRQIAKVPTDHNDRPRIPITIVECGELDDKLAHLKYDPFQKKIFEEQNKLKKEMIQKVEEETQRKMTALLGQDKIKKEQTQQEQEQQQIDDFNEIMEKDDKLQNIIDTSKIFNNNQKNKLIELKLKINEARTQNLKAVQEEEKLLKDPNFEKNIKRDILKEKWQQENEELQFKGIDKDKAYLNETALRQQNRENNKKKKHETFGWDVFNTDTLYRAYKKRCDNLPFYQDNYEKQMEEQDENDEIIKPNEEQLNNLVKDLEQQDAKKKQFSRRRTFYEDKDVNYINERNRVYNQKLERSFAAYTKDIKSNLERGTAI